MANYDIEVSATAELQLRRLHKQEQVRVLKRITQLAVDPRPPGARKLQGYDDVFRVRVGVYRILYSIDNGRLVVILLKIGHRKDVYR